MIKAASTRLRGRRFAAAAAFVLLAGCAAVPVPETQLAVSRSAVDEALRAGAASAAPIELRSAGDKLARADEAAAQGMNDMARRLAEEAEVDARLAVAKARTAHAELAVAEIRESTRALRESPPPISPTP